jgi:hypothetical protein
MVRPYLKIPKRKRDRVRRGRGMEGKRWEDEHNSFSILVIAALY